MRAGVVFLLTAAAGWAELPPRALRKIVIRPGPAAGLDWVNAKYDSIRGISSRWKRSAGRFELEVTVPANTGARVAVPARDAASVTGSGRPVKVEKMEDGLAWIAVPSGTWRFASDI